MPFRVTDSLMSARLIEQLATARQRQAKAQEQIASGQRINRPSDDPVGAEKVMNIRVSQAALEQFKKTVTQADEKLRVGDNALESYEQLLDRAGALLAQGLSDFTTQDARQSLAVEIDGLRERALSIAQMKHGDEYLFGGTRQDQPPFDSTGAPAPTPSSEQLLQIEPDAPPVITGVRAEDVFSDGSGSIFDLLSAAATALRGTGDPVADRATLENAMGRLKALTSQVQASRTRLGVAMERVESVGSRLDADNLSLETIAQQFESADFAEAAVRFTEASNLIEAITQSARLNRNSIVDILG